MIFEAKYLILTLYFMEKLASKISPLTTPSFDNEGEIKRILLPIDNDTEITSYEILEASLNVDDDTFYSIYFNKEIMLIENKLIINLGEKCKNEGMLYTICVITKEKNKYYSESFVYNKKRGYSLARCYEESKFYKVYGPHIGGALAVGGAATLIYYFLR